MTLSKHSSRFDSMVNTTVPLFQRTHQYDYSLQKKWESWPRSWPAPTQSSHLKKLRRIKMADEMARCVMGIDLPCQSKPV